MESAKWFVWSRGLWGGLIPLIVAGASAYGYTTDGLEQQLTEVGTNTLLVAGGLLALWSRFRPDGKALTPAPTAPASLQSTP